MNENISARNPLRRASLFATFQVVRIRHCLADNRNRVSSWSQTNVLRRTPTEAKGAPTHVSQTETTTYVNRLHIHSEPDRTMTASSSTPSSFLQSFCAMWSRISNRRRCRCRPRCIPPPTITLYLDSEEPSHDLSTTDVDENMDNDNQYLLARQLRDVHKQYRAGLVSEREFRVVKASMLIHVLRRQSAASTGTTDGSSSASSSTSTCFTMSTPEDFRRALQSSELSSSAEVEPR